MKNIKKYTDFLTESVKLHPEMQEFLDELRGIDAATNDYSVFRVPTESFNKFKEKQKKIDFKITKAYDYEYHLELNND